MSSITINATSGTYVDGFTDDNKDKNYSANKYVIAGAYSWYTSTGYWYKYNESGQNSVFFFKIPDSLKHDYIKIQGVKLKARKRAANSIDTSSSSNKPKTYSGVTLRYYTKNDLSSEFASSLTWNNFESLMGISPSNRGNQSISVSSVNADEQFSVDLPVFDSMSNSIYYALALQGLLTGSKGMFYQASLYNNTADTMLIVTYADKRPVAKITSYETSCSTTHSQTISWKYSSELSNEQASVDIEYSIDAGATWTVLATVEGDDTSYDVPADTFSEGNVYFRIKATDSEGNVGEYSSTVYTNYHIPRPEIAFTDWDTVNLNRVATLPITWSYESDDDYKQAQYWLEWSIDNSTWTTITNETTEQFYTFPLKSFPVGTIYLRLKVKDTHGLESAYATKTFTVYNQIPIVTCSYPSNVTINTSNQIIFTWSFTEEIERGQKSYELMYSQDNESTWTTVTEETINQYHTFAADTFETGTVIWKVRAIDIDDNVSEWSKTSFTAIGATEAPTVISVTNSSIPTVTWSAEAQDCFEINIMDTSNKYLYKSQLQMGSETTSFTCPVMLENGMYILQIRVLNIYGVYTAWTSYSFQINLPAPEAPTDVFVYLDNDLGVAVDGTNAAGTTTYVVRRDEDTQEIKILSVFIGNTVKDYTAGFGKTYSYTLRSYGGTDTAGYADGAWTVINIPIDSHVVLHNNVDRSIYVDMHEALNDWDVSRADSYTRSYRFTVGRAMPVVERTDWNTSTRTFSAWVSDDDLTKLRNMHNQNVYYRSDGEAFLADMVMSEGEKYVTSGKIVTIKITRINEDEVSVL